MHFYFSKRFQKKNKMLKFFLKIRIIFDGISLKNDPLIVEKILYPTFDFLFLAKSNIVTLGECRPFVADNSGM